MDSILSHCSMLVNRVKSKYNNCVACSEIFSMMVDEFENAIATFCGNNNCQWGDGDNCYYILDRSSTDLCKIALDYEIREGHVKLYETISFIPNTTFTNIADYIENKKKGVSENE